MCRHTALYFALFTCIFCSLSAVAEDTNTPVRFGATLSLSSNTGPFAQACARGVEMAVEDVNSAGGIGGRRLEVPVEDFTESELIRAASAAQKLITIDKVVALLPNWSEDAEVIAPIAELHGLVSMTLGAGGPRASRFAPSAFRATTSDDELAQAAVRNERAQGSKRACLLVADTGYYVDISKVILSTWRASGGEVAFSESIPHGNTDVLTMVTKLRSARCDSVFIWAAPATIGPFISGIRQQNIRARRVLPWFADTPEILERTRGDDQPYTLHRWSFDNAAFADRYQARYGESIIRPVGNCYDGVRVLAFVMGRVGTNGAKVREALLHLSGYTGVTGPFIITADRERTGERFKSFVIVDGKLEEVKP